MKKKTKKESAPPAPSAIRRHREIAAALALLVLLVGLALLLRGTAEERALSAAQKRRFAAARVTQVLEDYAQEDTWTEGRRIGQQLLERRLQIVHGLRPAPEEGIRLRRL